DAAKPRRGDADDGELLRSERQLPAEDTRVTAELPVPECIGDDRDGRAVVQAILLSRVESPEAWPHAEDVEIARGRAGGANGFRILTEAELPRRWAEEVRDRCASVE